MFGQGAVSIFGVINCVPATTPAHNVFCYLHLHTTFFFT